jgi:hypothetical protein
MKAIVQDRYGSPDVLVLREIDEPVIGDDEVLVRARAARSSSLSNGASAESRSAPRHQRRFHCGRGAALMGEGSEQGPSRCSFARNSPVRA